jgi:ligand-binding sensor domain-containing protein
MSEVLTEEQWARQRRVRIRQLGGDDGYQWCLIVDGVVQYDGMTRREAQWRRDRFVKEHRRGAQDHRQRVGDIHRMARMSSTQARAILNRARIDPKIDFHALRSEQVDELLIAADAWKYRKPKGANSSRASYFHAYIIRSLLHPEGF